MRYIGTSGFNYPEWLGKFYPTDLKRARMLAFYAGQFNSVEINYTFFRAPSEKTLRAWSAETPDGFRFGFKAPRFITHTRKLSEVAEATERFFASLKPIAAKLGVVLFQLPPTLAADWNLIETFLATLPTKPRIAIEFRHSSWFDTKLYELLRAHNVALCVADSEDLSTPVEQTADFTYFRLRNEHYTDSDIQRWARIAKALSARSTDFYVYFKHEALATGPRFAKQFEALISS